MGGQGPDILICNSGLTEAGYRFGELQRKKMKVEENAELESTRLYRKVRRIKQVMETKIDGFMYMSHFGQEKLFITTAFDFNLH